MNLLQNKRTEGYEKTVFFASVRPETHVKKLISFLLLIIIPAFCFGHGSSYAGPYKASAPIVLRGVKNRTISGLQISNPTGNCITLINCTNITIKNCRLGPSKGEGVSISDCVNVWVINCTLDSIRSGVYAVSSSEIKFVFNDVRNVIGPMPRGQMAQFDKVTGRLNRISFNVVENLPGQSAPEDVISLYKSSGTPADPIKVVGNHIRGGGPSTSGGGIMAGDRGGSYILIEDNILVNPGQYGISVASGHNIIIRNNKIFSRQMSFTNVGLVAWKQYPDIETHSITIMNNEVNYTNKNGILNNWWNAGNSGIITGWETNRYNPLLDESILPVRLIGQGAAKTRKK